MKKTALKWLRGLGDDGEDEAAQKGGQVERRMVLVDMEGNVASLMTHVGGDVMDGVEVDDAFLHDVKRRFGGGEEVEVLVRAGRVVSLAPAQSKA